MMLVVVPMVTHPFTASLLREACLSAVFLTALIVNRQRPRILVLGISIAAIALPLNWATTIFHSPGLILAAYASGMAFLSIIAGMILVSVFRDHMGTVDAVVGAICVYLLIGLTAALLYSALEYVQDEPFDNPRRSVAVELPDGRQMTSYSQMVYFSFITMSTLGYGDIVPKTPLAQTLTWMQSVLGQLYLAVLVARLVTVLPSTNREQEDG
jgi:uncharacterized membrane protein